MFKIEIEFSDLLLRLPIPIRKRNFNDIKNSQLLTLLQNRSSFVVYYILYIGIIDQNGRPTGL